MGVLLHQQHSGAGFVDLLDDAEDFLHQDGGQAHGRLIHHQQLWMAHQRAAHGQHLLLAAGQGAGILLHALLQAGKMREHHVQILLRFGAAAAGISAHFQVFHHRHGGEYAAAFRHLG